MEEGVLERNSPLYFLLNEFRQRLSIFFMVRKRIILFIVFILGILLLVFYALPANIFSQNEPTLNKFGEHLRCNFPKCTQIPLPPNVKIPSGASARLQKLLEYRNDWAILEYSKMRQMCNRWKYKTLLRPGTHREVKVHLLSEYTHFDVGFDPFVNFNLSECSVPCSMVAGAKSADIILRVQLTHMEEYGITEVRYDEYVRKLRRNQLLAVMSLETALSNPYLGVGGNLGTNGIDVLMNHVDYIIHSFPFSDIPLHSHYEHYRELIPLPRGAEFKRALLENLHRGKQTETSARIVSFTSKCSLIYTHISYYRTLFILELAEYVKIDEFGNFKGGCVHFAPWKRKLNDSALRLTDDFYATKIATFQKYKFALTFESANVFNYVTEKLFHGISAGFTIPIYLGAPNVHEFLPRALRNKKVFINANDYTPAELAEYILYLDSNAEAYLEYFEWRFEEEEEEEEEGEEEEDERELFEIPEYVFVHNEERNSRGEHVSYVCRLCELQYWGRRTCHVSDAEYEDNSLIPKN